MKKRILIIDDSPADRRIYRRFLERSADKSVSFEIVEADSGKAGLAACKSGGADCIILDFQLRDMNGLDLINDLHEHCNAPIIFVTGDPLPLTQTRSYRLGVTKFLPKDFLSSETLLLAVKEALQ